MLRSPPDANDDHLRRLLDQRATRADLHSRAMSEFSDTPSMYSHAFFSPRPGDMDDDDDDSASFISPAPPKLIAAQRADRDRLNELAVSMLDLSDDPRASIASSSTYDAEEHDGVDHDDDDDEPMPRMSLLGPKMRFHSKAPWELDDSPLLEEDEGEMDYVRGPGSGKDNFTVASSAQSIQASVDSGRSPQYVKRSFESSSSYSRGPPSQQGSVSSFQPGTGAFSISRVRSHSPARISHSPLLLPASRSPPESYLSSLDDEENTLTRFRSNSSRPSVSSAEEFHPYANPNHARSTSSNSYRRAPEVSSSLAYSVPTVPRSDSSATVTEGPFGKQPSLLDHQPSDPNVPRSPRSIFQGKDISSPMILTNPGRQTDPSGRDSPDPRSAHFPGWMEKGPSSPNFNLISLEEARAQRSRSATMQSTVNLPFPERDLDRVSGHSPSGSVASRARARSISAGARAKQAITNIVGAPKPERRESEPAIVVNNATPSSVSPGKNLKHKKSGFLRLFNGRDDKSPPPPMPSLSDGFAAFNAQQSTPKSTKASPHRIPVPPLSPVLAPDEPTSFSRSPKRTPPPLLINTASPLSMSQTPSTGVPRFTDRLGPTGFGTIPQSAPANVTEFPALKLRPVSTMFSAHFGDHLLPGSSVTSPTELDTPSTAVSTTSLRFDDKPSADDQSSVIRALQDQITSAKKAWQRHIWELEGQIRDLKEEVDTLRSADKDDYCSTCGRGQHVASSDGDTKPLSIVNRPRARTGTGTSRFGSAV